jgi:acyl-CoA synthetase (AMP-forming)/AMP-acid ligase II
VKYNVDEDEPLRGDNVFMQKVKVGETGLLLGEITEENPFVGYISREATESKIFRDVFTKGDVWFNTGDLIRDIGFSHVQFVDRIGDTFRWKGENVSTTMVEEVADTHSKISMSAAYGVLMPGGDGRAGMAAIISETKPEDFDFKGLAEHFQRVLPSYSVPKFIRFKTEFEYTSTHKIKKVNLKKEGFNPRIMTDPLYVLLPSESAYKPLTKRIYAEIMEGKYRF